MTAYGDMQRFFKPLAVKLSDRIAEMAVIHERRVAGRSKYGFLRLVDLFFDFLTNFSRQIFQRVAVVGFGMSAVGFLCEVLYLLLRFVFGMIPEPLDRFQAIVLAGFILGVQLLVLGVLGDFVIKIYRKMEAKPLYRIKKVW